MYGTVSLFSVSYLTSYKSWEKGNWSSNAPAHYIYFFMAVYFQLAKHMNIAKITVGSGDHRKIFPSTISTRNKALSCTSFVVLRGNQLKQSHT